MLRLVAYLTITCFLTVTALGNGCGQICVRGECGAVDNTESEPESTPPCNSCCPSKETIADSPCHQKRQAEQPQQRPCGSAPTKCAGSSCLPDTKNVSEASPKIDRQPCETKCGQCIRPHLEFTLGEKQGSTPKPVLAIGSGRYSYGNDLSVTLSGDKNRPGEIHHIISTTILRL